MPAQASVPPESAVPARPREVLLIDANEDHQTLSALALGRRGFKVTAVASGKEGLRLALSRPFDAIVLDHKVREASSFEILATLVKRVPRTPKLFVVPVGGEDHAVRALSAGATGYLVKTARFNEVLALQVQEEIEKAGDRARLEEQERALEAGLAERKEIEEVLLRFVSAQIALVVDRARAEERLRGSERTVSTLMHALPGVVYRCRNDADWTYEFVSSGCAQILGYPAKALLGDHKITGLDLIHPDDRERVREETEAAVHERRPYSIRYRIRSGAGPPRWVLDQGHGVYAADGSAVAVEGIVTELSDEATATVGERFIKQAPFRSPG